MKSEILGKMDQKTNFFNVIRDLHLQAHFVEQQVCLLCSSWFLCQQRDREEKLRLESRFQILGKVGRRNMEEEYPNKTYTVDNVTYCWHPEIESYSWCPQDPSANQVDTGAYFSSTFP